MEPDETNDFAEEAEIDRVELSEDDDPKLQDELDPVEQDDQEIIAEEGTDDEADEVEANDEVEDQEAEVEPEAAELSDDVMVKMADGSQVSLRELKDSPMLKADHTRKTQKLAASEKALFEKSQHLEQVTSFIVKKIADSMPQQPDPNLAITDPAKYVQQQAQAQAAELQLAELVKGAQEAAGIAKQVDQDALANLKASEHEKLVAALPELGQPDNHSKFIKDVEGLAAELGFAEGDIGKIVDHKVFRLAHLALKGAAAEKAQKTVKEKVRKAPPAKAVKPGQGARKANQRDAARRRLSADDSIENAVAALMAGR